jgi:hypothetical protein
MKAKVKQAKMTETQELEQQIKEYEGKIQKLKEEIPNLERSEKIFLGKEKAEAIEPEKVYDKIINFESINELFDFNKLTGGWTSPNYEEEMGMGRLVFGILGNFNRGKTFFISRLCGVNLPSGFSVHTKGLSVKFLGETIALLDSAGYETPLKIYEKGGGLDNDTLKKQNEQIQNIMIDRTHTELFTQRFIADSSDDLILVMGKLCFSEQKLKNNLDKLYPEKEIFIVHNLMHLTEIQDVENYIENTLMGAFDLQPDTFNDTTMIQGHNEVYYSEKLGEKIKRTHLIIAREGSPAGEYYNISTYEFFRSRLAGFDRKIFDIEKSLEKSFDLKRGDIYNINNDPPTQKRVFVNEVGFENNSSYKSSVFKLGKKLVIQLEITCLKDIECVNVDSGLQKSGYFNIKISGKRQVPQNGYEIVLDNFDIQEDFLYETKVRASDHKVGKNHEKRYENGILTVEFNLR